ncbi:MAG: hypothetical protein IJ877_07480 [Candidatus Gastranaerophilales bacterium]|nr:hypothetical protein [Candidatus Gastranaerophilales bacterium]
MIKDDYIIIPFKGVKYNINVKKLELVLSKLENKEVILTNNNDVKELLRKYKLYDEYFLENINKI